MNDDIIKQAIAALENGGTLLYPTDTIWGIGCDATNANAVEKIYSIKQRDPNKSMLILCSDIEQLEKYVVSLPQVDSDIMKNSSKPTTIIYPEARNLPASLVANDGSIGIRIPNMEFCQTLLRTFGKPIVSTSANFSGMPSAMNYKDIDPKIIQLVDYAVPNLPQFESKDYSSRILKVDSSNNIIVIRD